MLNPRFGVLVSRSAGVVDQFSWSLCSVILTVLLARSLSASDFGKFAIAQMIAFSSLTYFRAVLGAWILTPSDTADNDGGAISASVVYGTGVSVILIAGGVVLPLNLEPAVLVVLASPCLLVAADALRLVAIGRGHYWRSATISGSFLAFFLLATVALHLGSQSKPVLYVAFYIASIAGAAMVGLLLVKPTSIGRGYLWWRANSRTLWADSGFAASEVLVSIASPSSIAAFGGAAVAGGVRGAQTLIGLPQQAAQGIRPHILAICARDVRLSGRTRGRVYFAFAIIQVVPLAIAIVGFTLIPDEIGTEILGDTWSLSIIAVPWLGAAAIFHQLALIAEIHYRAQRRTAKISGLNFVLKVVQVGAGALGAGLYGIVGAASFIMVSALVTVITLTAVTVFDPENRGTIRF